MLALWEGDKLSTFTVTHKDWFHLCSFHSWSPRPPNLKLFWAVIVGGIPVISILIVEIDYRLFVWVGEYRGKKVCGWYEKGWLCYQSSRTASCAIPALQLDETFLENANQPQLWQTFLYQMLDFHLFFCFSAQLHSVSVLLHNQKRTSTDSFTTDHIHVFTIL